MDDPEEVEIWRAEYATCVATFKKFHDMDNDIQEQCWWRSGPKGGCRHNSPLSSLPPFGYRYEATSTTRARKGNAETLNNTGKETGKYSVDQRPKDKQTPSVLSSHYSVSVSLQGVHYL
jgi:hypothetical protein